MPHPPCPIPRPLPAAVLDRLARELAEGHAGAPHASLVRARPSARGVDVGLCALPEGVHPAEALVGHVIPPAWVASGVVAPAHARPVEEAPAHGTGTPTTVVMLVGRDGHVTSHAVGIDGLEAGSEPPIGRIPDLLRRTVGLPTAPTTTPAAEWWRACWLDALVAAAAVDPGPDPDRPLTSTLPPDLVQALVDEPALCDVAGWGRIRKLAAMPDPPPEPGPAAVRASVAPFVDPAQAAWFDDGCFARWLLDALPSVEELLDLAAALVAPELLDLLRQVAGHEGEPAPQGARGGVDAPR